MKHMESPAVQTDQEGFFIQGLEIHGEIGYTIHFVSGQSEPSMGRE